MPIDDEVPQSQMPRGNRGWDEHNRAVNQAQATTPDRTTVPSNFVPRKPKQESHEYGKRGNRTLKFNSPKQPVVEVSSPPSIRRVGSKVGDVIDASLARTERIVTIAHAQQLLEAEIDIRGLKTEVESLQKSRREMKTELNDLKRALAKSLESNAALDEMAAINHQTQVQFEKAIAALETIAKATADKVNGLETEMADMEGTVSARLDTIERDAIDAYGNALGKRKRTELTAECKQ